MRRSEATALTWADVELRDNGSALLQSAGPRPTRRARAWSSTSAGRHRRLCGPSGPRSNSLTGTHRFSGSLPGRSADGCRPSPRLRASVMASPDKAAVSAWPRTWSRAGLSCRRDDLRPVEERQDAGPLHRAPGGRPGGGDPVLPGRPRGLRGLMLVAAADNVSSSPSRWA